MDPSRRRCSCRAGSATRSRRWRTTPPTPTSSTTTGVPGRDVPTRSSTSPTRPWRSPGRSRSSGAELSDKDRAHPRLADVRPDAAPPQDARPGRGRPARPGAARRAARARPPSTASRRPRPRRHGGRWQASTVARLRHRHQRRRLHRRRRRRDRRRPPGGLGGQRRPGSAALAAARARAPVHAGARLHRLRLRRHRRARHPEDEPFARSGVYGQTKAAGDARGRRRRRGTTSCAPVLGDRRRPQLRAHHGRRSPTAGIDPSVVDDQFGRLTFTDELARATAHLLDIEAPYGTYNVSNGGPDHLGRHRAGGVPAARPRPGGVTGVSTEEYFADRAGAPRPRNSVLDLEPPGGDRLRAGGRRRGPHGVRRAVPPADSRPEAVRQRRVSRRPRGGHRPGRRSPRSRR